MKATIEVELKPFITPNYAIEIDSDSNTTGIALSKLTPIVLSNMCDEFRREVFRKAGKQQPPTACSCCK